MIYHQLPPLNSVKAFDAVIRHGSISEAARVLCVSQSAISRHISKLEDFLGCKLLVRSKLGTTPTAEGQMLCAQVSESFDSLLAVSTKIKAAQSGLSIVKISSLSSFAVRWLVPRLGQFQALHPDIVLDVSISDQRPDFVQSKTDCAIVSSYPKHISNRDYILFAEELIVVASPALLKGTKVVDEAELNQYPLIHTSTRAELWESMYQYLGLTDNSQSSLGLTFQDYYISIAACVAGSGLALVPSFLVKGELEDGLLIQVIKQTLVSGKKYQLAISPLKSHSSSILAFKDWLLQEVAKN